MMKTASYCGWYTLPHHRGHSGCLPVSRALTSPMSSSPNMNMELIGNVFPFSGFLFRVNKSWNWPAG